MVNCLCWWYFEIFNMEMQTFFYSGPIFCFNKGILRKLKYHIDIL